MSNVEPAASSKLGQAGSSHFWNFKQNGSTALLMDGRDGRVHGTPSTTLHQSASYAHLASAPDTFTLGSNTEKAGIKRTFSENILSNLGSGIEVQVSPGALADGSVEGSRYSKLLRRKSSRFQIVTKFIGTKITLAEQQANPELAELSKASSRDINLQHEAKIQSVSGSMSNLARTWIGASRSPSPNKRHSMAAKCPVADMSSEKVHRRRLSLEGSFEQKRSVDKRSGTTKGHAIELEQKNTAGKTRRPLSAILGKSPQLDEENPVLPHLPGSLSHEKLAAVRHGHPALDSLPPVLPRLSSTERLSSFGSDTARRRDELWSSFRALDGEFQKFVSKPTTSKANIIRGALLPFLRTYANHHSNTSLRAEDLERRVFILNQWWIGLLEMLSGRNGQAISGNDRPAILEGVAGIMVRPEWRLPISAIHCRADKSRPPLRSKSSTSLESTSSLTLAESVYQTVRKSFVRNLLSQMAFVVERMSLRNVPASIVAFCGKAIAYAFFFCPGVADILVHLWFVSMNAIRRVLSETDIMKDTNNVKQEADRIANGFPPHLRGLAFRSLPLLMKYLRCRPQSHTDFSDIPWYGPWLGRWAGRDSDLFFVFVKHHHVLFCGLLPEDATELDRISAPTYLLVQAQLLTVMDATIHRATSLSQIESSDAPVSISFDDMLTADAAATPLPLRAPNASRLMAENRLIMLVRELLSDRSGVNESARASFARSFAFLLKVAARRTSKFDHIACFTLCDLLEEAIIILARYHHNTDDPISFLDWSFWRGVLEQMLESNNNMTEVRVYAFVYSLWGFITKNDERKRQITVDWLLTETCFQRQFNHWCPMVRAYYMRLLCWRIARFDGEPSETELLIYTTLSLRLRQTWSHFIYAQDNAKKYGTIPPSTTPCNPAPGRRLQIVRNDVYTSLGGVFTSFEGILPTSETGPSPAHERQSFLNPLKDLPNVPDLMDFTRSSNSGRKRWRMLRTMNPFHSMQIEPARTSTFSITSDNADSTRPHRTITEANPTSGKIVAEVNAVANERNPQHQHLSFKFSLEWNNRVPPKPKDYCLYPPTLPLPAQIFLQSKQPQPHDIFPCKPEGVATHTSKYSGRALAEWTILINECQNFFERRKYEGVLGLKRVETPTLGVEAFRRPG